MLSVPAIFRKPAVVRPTWGLPLPDGLVSLTISGRICWPNSADTLALTAPLMRTFATRDIVTTTDWPDLAKPQHFSGFALIDLLRAAGWRGTAITLSGADGYSVETTIPAIREQGALVANMLNDMPMQCTRYAPLWLVFPFDDATDRIARGYQTSRSVWSLTHIAVH